MIKWIGTVLIFTLLPATAVRGQEGLPPIGDSGGAVEFPYSPVLPEPEAREPQVFGLTKPSAADGGQRAPGGFGAATGGGMPGGPMGGPPGHAAVWYSTRPVLGQPANLGFVRQGLRFGAPLWRGESDMLIASVRVENSLFSTDAVLPDSQQPFPDQLWNLNFGFNQLHSFDNGWTGALMTGFGSASDKPFHSIDEVTATIGGILRIPARNERDAWRFGLMYMWGGPVNFPLPIMAYDWIASDELHVNIGLPFSVLWVPSDEVTVQLSYMPLNNVNARLTYRASPMMNFYGAYEFLNESYFLTDRTVTQDRFFAFEQRLVTGVQWELGNLIGEVNGGYSFGRNYGEGLSQWSALTNRVDVDPGAFVGINIRLGY